MSRWVEVPKTSRQGGLKIEVPEVPWSEPFLKTALSLLPKVRESLHPVLRKANMIVQFPERMILTGDQGNTFKGKAEIVYGDAVLFSRRRRRSVTTSASRLDISVSLAAVMQAGEVVRETSEHISALGLILHEIEEANFSLQSATPYERGKVGDPSYLDNDHETIPTRRALRWLKQENGCDYLLNKGFFCLASKYDLREK